MHLSESSMLTIRLVEQEPTTSTESSMGLTMAQQRQAPSHFKEESGDTVSCDLLIFLSHTFLFLLFLFFFPWPVPHHVSR